MAPGNNNSSNNNNSNTYHNTNNNNNVLQRRALITPEQYLLNQQWIQQQAAMLMEYNRRGIEAYAEARASLQQRVEEGERARQQLQNMQLLSGRNIAGTSSNPSGPPQYSTYTSMVNTLAPVVPHNYANTRNVDAFMTDAQNAYSSNVALTNAGPTIEEISSPLPEQFDASSGTAFHRPPAQSFGTQNANGGHSLQTAPMQSQRAYLPPSQGGAIASSNPVQPLFQHPVAHGQPSLSSSAISAPEPSTMRTKVPQRPVSNAYAVSQNPLRAEQPSGSGPVALPTAGSSYHAVVPVSSGSSSALAGALGENSSIQAQRSNTNGHSSADDLDFWTRIDNEKRATAGTRTKEAQTNLGAQTTPANQQKPVTVYTASEQRKETLPVTPPLITTSFSAPDKTFSRAQIATARHEINDLISHSHQNSTVDSPNNYLQSRGVSDYQMTSTWNQQAPVKPASSGPPSSAGVAPQPTRAATSISHTRGPIPSFSGSSTSAAFVAGSSGLNSRPYGAQISSSNLASADQMNPSHVTPAATVANAISTQSYSGSSGSTIQNPYSTAIQYSSTFGPSSHAASHFNGAPSEARHMTPPSDRNRPSGPITPASANRKTIAKDILRALNVSAEKRKASASPETSDDDQRPRAKKQAIEPSSVDIPVLIPDVFTMTSALPIADASNSARIEEVVETLAESHLTNVSSPPAASTLDGVRKESPKVTEVTEEVEAPDAAVVADRLPRDEPTVESRASSEDIVEVDTALQPYKESSMPLFLPTPDSPPSSTSPRRGASTSGIHHLTSRSTGLEGGRRHRKQVYVEVPMLTDAQRRLFLRQYVSGNEGDEKESRDLLSVLHSQKSSRVASSTVPKVDVDENRIRLAQEANKVAASRLRRRPCMWSDCFHVSNCANSLEFHVGDHIALIQDEEKIFACWWGDCLRRFNKREALAQHVQHHVKKLIYCAYQGCEEQFTRPLDLLSHVENKHPPGSPLRPSILPFTPSLQTSPLPALKTMLAFYDVPIPVRMSQMSMESRASLGPWVAQRCFGAVNLGTPKLAARKPNQRRQPGDGETRLLGDGQDRYDFLEPWSTRFTSHCSDVESAKATEEIEAGLLLAPDIAGPQGPLEEHVLTSRVDRIKLDDSQEYAIVAEGGLEGPEVGTEVAEIKLEPTMSDPVPQGLQMPPTATFQETVGSPAYKDFLGVGEPQLVELGTA